MGTTSQTVAADAQLADLTGGFHRVGVDSFVLLADILRGAAASSPRQESATCQQPLAGQQGKNGESNCTSWKLHSVDGEEGSHFLEASTQALGATSHFPLGPVSLLSHAIIIHAFEGKISTHWCAEKFLLLNSS
jgi:hypothetical protein